MGVLEVADGYLGEEVKLHRSGGWANPRYQRHEAKQARQNLQEAAEIAEEFYRETSTRRLILASTEKNVAHFNDLLSHRLRTMVIGHFNADANASQSDIRDKALEMAAKAEEKESQALADRVLSIAQQGGNAVLGVVDTLTAVQHGRAQHVVALADYSQHAFRFVHSGLVVLELTEEGDLASGRIQDLPDAAESALRRALVQSIGVTLVEQHASLAQAGKIGALTRWVGCAGQAGFLQETRLVRHEFIASSRQTPHPMVNFHQLVRSFWLARGNIHFGSTGIHVVGSYVPGTGLRCLGRADNDQPVPGT